MQILTILVYLVVFFIIAWVEYILYTTVMQYFWADGPERIINPDFWMFLLATILIGMLFGRSSN